jgi:putative transposon-encoded protein
MENSVDLSVAEQPMEIKITGYEVVEKIAKPCASSGRVLVPRSWVGKRVRIIRVDP